MLGIILIYFVGKKFYELAFEHNKSRWGFAIAGVAIYYVFMFIGAFIFAMVIEISSPGYITESNETWLGMLGIPVGVLACWGFYKILENSWSKARVAAELDTLDGGMINRTSDQP